jgi:hypothetical protein
VVPSGTTVVVEEAVETATGAPTIVPTAVPTGRIAPDEADEILIGPFTFTGPLTLTGPVTFKGVGVVLRGVLAHPERSAISTAKTDKCIVSFIY